MPASTVIFLGLVNWLATTILVESELFRPIRDRLVGQAPRWRAEGYASRVEMVRELRQAQPTARLAALAEWASQSVPARAKVNYLVGCHLCAGTWVGLAIALVAGSPIPGVLGLMLGALVFKAIGHITLEATAALRRVGA